MCAVNGTNFYKSAMESFNLLMRNIVRVAVLNNTCNFLLLIGKVIIVFSCGSLTYLAFGGYIPKIKESIPIINYFFVPCIIVSILSYLISTAFFSVYSMAVDTLFLCFLEDLERNDGTAEKPYFMSKGLQKIVGEMNQFKLLENPEGTPLVQLQK